MVSHVGDRARSRVAAVLERVGLRGAQRVPDAYASVDADGEGAGPDAVADPEFAPVSVESLERVLEGLRQLS